MTVAMSGLIIDGVEYEVPGVRVVTWLEDPSIRIRPEDGRPRKTTWVHIIAIHATVGDEPQRILGGAGAPGLARRTINAWGARDHVAAAHLVIDADGTVYQLADLVRDVAYHAREINEVSIGIELAQTSKLEIRQVQLDVCVAVDDRITLVLGLARQLQWPYLGEAMPVARLAAGGNQPGREYVGICGHRDQTTARGPGDPGDAVMRAHLVAGYEGWDFERCEDMQRWAGRQRMANSRGANLVIDGIPGPATVAAMKRYMQRPSGLWVLRPGDSAAMTVV